MPAPPDTTAAGTVAAILGSADPLELVLSSEDFDTWRVGSDRVVKFARSEEHAAKVRVEHALHTLVRAELGELVPAIAFVGEPSARFPWMFLGYEVARGRQGQTLDGSTLAVDPSVAVDLAAALRRLHGIDAGLARAVGAGDRTLALDPPVLDPITLDRCVEIAGARVRDFLDAAPPAPAPDPPVLCHADLKGEHVFVDARGIHLTALIDWADAEFCDPAKDLAGLAIWQGPAFVREVGEAYGGEDPGLIDRAVWLARAGLLAFIQEVDRGRTDAPASLLRAQLLAAFSD